jgi:hypothetical protein
MTQPTRIKLLYPFAGTKSMRFDRSPLPIELASSQTAAKEMAKKASDLGEIKKTVEDAAEVSGALWFSYLFTFFYFAVAAGAVTHVDLFLENPVKLPFLGVDLPMLAFFFLAPIIFVLVHVYILLHLRYADR